MDLRKISMSYNFYKFDNKESDDKWDKTNEEARW